MSDDMAEFEADRLLRAIGQVQLPAPRVLEAAREALWSAIASEMLGTAPAERRISQRQPDRSMEADTDGTYGT